MGDSHIDESGGGQSREDRRGYISFGLIRGAQVAAPDREAFGLLDAKGRKQILRALVKDGVARAARSGDLRGALEQFAQVAKLGEPIFSELDAEGRTYVLQAIAQTSSMRFSIGDFRGALSGYTSASTLAGPIFDQLDAEGRSAILAAHVNAGVARGLSLRDPRGALDEFARVTALGEPIFSCLDDEGRSQVLKGRFNAGVTRDEGLNDPKGALLEYAQVARLGEPVFDSLNSVGRNQILMARFNAGAIHRDRLNNAMGALVEYARVAAIGEMVFGSLDSQGRCQVLMARLDAGSTRASRMGDHLGALIEFERVAAIGEAEFALLDGRGRRQLLLARVTSGASLRWQNFGNTRNAVASFFLGSSGADLEASAPRAPISAVLHTRLRRMDLPVAQSVARWWLVSLSAYPGNPQHRRQCRLALGLSAGLIHGDLHALRSTHRDWLALGSGAAAPVATTGSARRPATFSQLLARACVAQVMQESEPLSLQRADALLLARVRAACESTAGWPETAPWRLDPAALADRVGLAGQFYASRRSDDEDIIVRDPNAPAPARQPDAPAPLFMYAPHAWLARAGQPRLNFLAFGEAAKSTTGELFDALLAWHRGDPTAATRMLDAAYGLAHGEADRLAPLLQRWGVPEAEAHALALDAAIYGDAQKVLTDTCEAWLEAQIAVTDRDRAIVGALATLPKPNPDQRLRDRLASLVDIELNASRDPAQHWTLLETGRFTLSSVSAEQIEPLPVDQQANERLQAAVQAEQAQLALRLERVNAGQPDTPVDFAHSDFTFSVFDVLQRELERLQRVPRFVQPSDCAALLQPGERLVQLRFGGNGCMQALVLAAGQPLQLLELHQVPGLLAWNDLLKAWDMSQAGRPNDAQSEIDNEAKMRKAREAAMAAWQTFVAADSPASALLRQLLPQAGHMQPGRCHVILPTVLAALPWLARAVSGTDPQRGDFAPGQLVLETSVSTWRNARQARSAPAQARTPAQARVLHLPLHETVPAKGEGLAQIEAQGVAQQLGVTPSTAQGFGDIAALLAAPGIKHLVVHGQFSETAGQPPGADKTSQQDAGKPKLQDGLYLADTDAHPVVQAWLLQAMQVQGELSLAACEAMRVSADPLGLGPVGIGPVLRAAGALSVTGPIRPSDQLVSALFYPLWYAQRREHSAVVALARVQQQLRTMKVQEVLQALPEDWRGWAIQYLGFLVDDAKKPPLSHPALWGNFTVLGDAPPLTQLSARAPAGSGNSSAPKPSDAQPSGWGRVLASVMSRFRRS